MRGLAKDPADRYATALEMARDIGALEMASALEVGEWVTSMAATTLTERAALVSAVESSATHTLSPAAKTPSIPDTETVAATVHRPAAPPAEDEAPTRVAWPGASRPRAVLVSPLRRRLAGRDPGHAPVPGFPQQQRAGACGCAERSRGAVSGSSRHADGADSERAAAPTADAVEPVVSASAKPAPAGVVRPKASRAPAPKPKPKPAQQCNPPYYIDKSGFKVYKPGCLE